LLHEELSLLPTPKKDTEGNIVYKTLANGGIEIDQNTGRKLCEIVACPEALAIINPRTKKFQCGDDVFYAVIARIRGELEDLEADVLASMAELRTVPAGGKQRVDEELKLQRKAVQIKKDYLQAAEAECERRGRACLMNNDEMPQAIAFEGSVGTRRRVGCAAGERPVQGVAENKEQFSVHPTVDLNGKWGPTNILLEQTSISEGVIPEELVRGHTGLTVQHTEHGIQTAASFLKYNKMVDENLDAELDSAFGKWKVKRPVVMCEDGHASRYDTEVMEYREEKKTRSFIEEGGTSGTFQLLDQLFKGCHEEYKSHCANIRFRMGVHYRITKFEAMQAMAVMFPPSGDGGCNPTWVKMVSTVHAYRNVGVTWCGISFEAMKKQNLRDDTADKGAAALAADKDRLVVIPPGSHYAARKRAASPGAGAEPQRPRLVVTSPSTPADVAAATTETPATSITLADIEDITLLSYKQAALAAWKTPFVPEAGLKNTSFAYLRVELDYQKTLTNQLGKALEKEAGPSDFSMLMDKESVRACWLQERPADFDSQTRRALKNPTGSMSASNFAAEKSHMRSERDSAATVTAKAKRAKKAEWGLCGVSCQCH
jgi:hypothetical protein